jgi:hypothetical protein
MTPGPGRRRAGHRPEAEVPGWIPAQKKVMRPDVTVYNSPVLPSEPSSRRPVRALAGRTFVAGRTGRLATTDSPALAGRALGPHGSRVGTLRFPRQQPIRVVSFSDWLSDRSQVEHYSAARNGRNTEHLFTNKHATGKRSRARVCRALTAPRLFLPSSRRDTGAVNP